MSFTAMKNTGPHITENEVIALEKMIGKNLPIGFREFLIKYNGGRPTESAFTFREGNKDEEDSIHMFHSIGYEISGHDFAWNIKTYRFRIPVDLLPIACDPFGNQICIQLGKVGDSSIYFWDHDKEHTPPTYRNVIKIADSFEQFLNDLYEDTPIYSSEIDKAICADDVILLAKLLTLDIDLETPNEWGRTMMEKAALRNSLNVMKFLFTRGAKLKNARAMVEENIKIVPELSQALALLEQMEHPQ